MLRYIIGGVALAATGYGVKKYLESDINIFDTFSEYEEKKEHRLYLHKGTKSDTRLKYSLI